MNGAGNFFYEGALALPCSAKVIAGGKERVMPVKQTSGDCNGCHRERRQWRTRTRHGAVTILAREQR